MITPYALMADLHAHNWSAFSEITAEGINSRLAYTLAEMVRAAAEVKKAGGSTLRIAGDVFHVRGSIAPTVLNPLRDTVREIIKLGVNIEILAGNHDLEGKDSARVSSAITALEEDGCVVINSWANGVGFRDHVIMAPWMKVAELKERLESVDPADRAGIDVILHAPIDGVMIGIPDHGLSPEYLTALGFKRVFSGHYHHHKDFSNGVYSIGAATHQTWSDVNSKAGFLIVHDDRVQWFASHAPAFVEITPATDKDEVPLLVDGNFVRVKLNTSKSADVEAARQFLTDMGAKGVTVVAQRDVSAATTRTTSTVKAGASIEVSVHEFVKASSFANQERLAQICNEILTEARSAT